MGQGDRGKERKSPIYMYLRPLEGKKKMRRNQAEENLDEIKV